MTQVYEFELVVDRNPTTDEAANALYEAGCDDATPGVQAGVPVVAFDREAESLEEAMASAVRDVTAAGLQVCGVGDGDLVTQAEIADRIGKSRQWVSKLYLDGAGPGGFPAPVAARPRAY